MITVRARSSCARRRVSKPSGVHEWAPASRARRSTMASAHGPPPMMARSQASRIRPLMWHANSCYKLKQVQKSVSSRSRERSRGAKVPFKFRVRRALSVITYVPHHRSRVPPRVPPHGPDRSRHCSVLTVHRRSRVPAPTNVSLARTTLGPLGAPSSRREKIFVSAGVCAGSDLGARSRSHRGGAVSEVHLM